MAGVDIWTFNEDGKAIEHWDVLQAIPEATASRNDPVLPTFLTD